MIEKTKTVYYCDFCKRHGLVRAAMLSHEDRCTLNPQRLCKWHEPRKSPSVGMLAADLRAYVSLTKDLLDELSDAVDGCPMCQLAALRQSGLDFHGGPSGTEARFDYDAAVAEYREHERWEAEQAEIRDIESTWA